MSAPKAHRPGWAEQYLRLDAWTQDELRNLLCGLPPVQPLDEPPRTREEATEYFVRAEGLRVVADRHIRDAVFAGSLTVASPVDDDLLAKVEPLLLPSEFDTVRRALVHERACKKSYFVKPPDAIRWASRRQDLFPDFPFDESDLPGGGAALDGKASEQLRAHRRGLVRHALDSKAMTDDGLRERLGVKADTVRAIINGDHERYSRATERRLLEVLGLTRAHWDREP